MSTWSVDRAVVEALSSVSTTSSEAVGSSSVTSSPSPSVSVSSVTSSSSTSSVSSGVSSTTSCVLEATSSVDSYSEEIIQIATNRLIKGKTSIIIAHRLATIKNSDKIIVLDNGRIVEEGTHNELLKTEKGFYKKLNEEDSLGLIKDL